MYQMHSIVTVTPPVIKDNKLLQNAYYEYYAVYKSNRSNTFLQLSGTSFIFYYKQDVASLNIPT